MERYANSAGFTLVLVGSLLQPLDPSLTPLGIIGGRDCPVEAGGVLNVVGQGLLVAHTQNGEGRSPVRVLVASTGQEVYGGYGQRRTGHHRSSVNDHVAVIQHYPLDTRSRNGHRAVGGRRLTPTTRS